jgi:putative tryptophan/tyrosine transport system substrate-binding protein
VKRRGFIAGLAGAAVWPVAPRAQQLPVIGLLDPGVSSASTDRVQGFHKGLSEVGFVEGQNVAVEYRWAENQIDRLPALVADLVRRRIAVIVT